MLQLAVFFYIYLIGLNHVPLHIRNIDSPLAFRKAIKTYLFPKII